MTFSERLKKTMQEIGITQSQLVGMTGIGKSSISQYLSGKNVPTKERRRDIAVSLGLEGDYFEREVPLVEKLAKRSDWAIPQMKTKAAGKLMRMGHATIEDGLKQGRFDWGYAIRMPSGQYRYFINARSFAEIERIEVPEEMIF